MDKEQRENVKNKGGEITFYVKNSLLMFGGCSAIYTLFSKSTLESAVGFGVATLCLVGSNKVKDAVTLKIGKRKRL